MASRLLQHARRFSTLFPLAEGKLSVENLKTIRSKTGLSISLCRQALLQSNDDVAAAFKWLDENEAARAERAKNKLSERVTSAGRISISSTPQTAAVVELNCETDFVARNENFEAIVKKIADVIVSAGGNTRSISCEEAKGITGSGGSVQSILNGALTTLGENVVLRRASIVHSGAGVVGGYVHNFGSYGAVVEVTSKDPAVALSPEKLGAYQEFASKVAQHIVAADPGDVTKDGLKKLLKQQFVFDSTMNIGQFLVKTSKLHGQGLAISSFLRWKCGAGQ